MRYKRSAVACGAVVLTVISAVGSIRSLRAAPPPADPKASKGVAVVELFTSEGCSSCPPADAAAAELIAKSQGKPVYVLAFHVDYWDRLGWPDRFAAKAYSDRQRQYATALKLDTIYTPQAVINGSQELVGSDRAKLDAAIADAIATPVVGTIEVAATRVDGDVKLSISGVNLPAGTIVSVALVEDGLTTEVRRGENRGRLLPHEHVVRAFESAALDDRGNGQAKLSIPTDTRPQKSKIIAFAQRPSDLHVLAAVEVALPK